MPVNAQNVPGTKRFLNICQIALDAITLHVFNTIKKINQANKHSTTKALDISTGDITRPKSCLKMAPFISVKYWVNMLISILRYGI